MLYSLAPRYSLALLQNSEFLTLLFKGGHDHSLHVGYRRTTKAAYKMEGSFPPATLREFELNNVLTVE